MTQNTENQSSRSILSDPQYLWTVVSDILKQWWLILAAGIIALTVTYITVSETYRPVYTSQATCVVSVTGTTSTVYTNLTSAGRIASAFSGMLNSRTMRNRICGVLGIDSFPGTVNAVQIPDTNLITVSVTASSPDEAWTFLDALLNNHTAITAQLLNSASISILQHPSVASSPSNDMHLWRTVCKVTAITMLSVVLLLALYFHFLHDTVKTEQEFRRGVDAHLLGTIYHERKKTLRTLFSNQKSGLLISDPRTSFGFVESYKKLRTAVEYAASGKSCRIIAVTSVFENEGKTTVAANLAVALAQKHARVLLVDGDIKRPAVMRLFGKGKNAAFGVTDLLQGTKSARDLLFTDPGSGLLILPGKPGDASVAEYIEPDALRKLLAKAREETDYIIIDTPPVSVGPDAESIVGYADAAILVVRQDIARVRTLNDTVDALKETGSKFLGCVFNNVRVASQVSAFRGYGYGYGYGYGGYHRQHYGQGGYTGRYARQEGRYAAAARQQEPEDSETPPKRR